MRHWAILDVRGSWCARAERGLLMGIAASANSELLRVAALRQGIRLIASNAFRVNTLGLNAILLAKRFGEQARGFGVISSELRGFSKALGREMGVMNDDSVQLVNLATRQMKLHRQMLLMAGASDSLNAPNRLMQAAVERQAAEHAAMAAGIRAIGIRMQQRIDDAYQVCLFGTVIARSARIEAAHAGPAGVALTEASLEFARQVEAILPSLELLKSAVKA